MTETATTIKAIETEYHGVRFRSRLEARWAVVFDALHTPWHYEPEAYAIPPFRELREDWDGNEVDGPAYPGRNYLPDFYLPALNAFFEVKGESPDHLYERQIAHLGRTMGRQVLLAIGQIPELGPYTYTDHIYQLAPYWDNYFEFARCSTCGRLGCVFSGYSDRICQCHPGETKGSDGHEEIAAAYDKARSYRFWEPAR